MLLRQPKKDLNAKSVSRDRCRGRQVAIQEHEHGLHKLSSAEISMVVVRLPGQLVDNVATAGGHCTTAVEVVRIFNRSLEGR